MGDWITLFNGENFDGWTWRKPEHEWTIGGGVNLRDDDPKLFAIERGTGVMVNGETGRTVDILTEMEHGSIELELEFSVAQKSNSGVYLQGQYEIQILDSWGTPDNELNYASNGAIYGRWIEETKTSYDGQPPRSNASRAPGEWQQLQVLFHAPQFDGDGNRTAPARFERVTLNGTVIHENFECTGPTRGAWNEADIALGPLRLQGDHGPVAYRNIRLREI